MNFPLGSYAGFVTDLVFWIYESVLWRIGVSPRIDRNFGAGVPTRPAYPGLWHGLLAFFTPPLKIPPYPAKSTAWLPPRDEVPWTPSVFVLPPHPNPLFPQHNRPGDSTSRSARRPPQPAMRNSPPLLSCLKHLPRLPFPFLRRREVTYGHYLLIPIPMVRSHIRHPRCFAYMKLQGAFSPPLQCILHFESHLHSLRSWRYYPTTPPRERGASGGRLRLPYGTAASRSPERLHAFPSRHRPGTAILESLPGPRRNVVFHVHT